MLKYNTNPFIERAINSFYCQNLLKKVPSEELAGLVKYIWDKHKGKTMNNLSMVTAGPRNDLFVGAGAFDDVKREIKEAVHEAKDDLKKT